MEIEEMLEPQTHVLGIVKHKDCLGLYRDLGEFVPITITYRRQPGAKKRVSRSKYHKINYVVSSGLELLDCVLGELSKKRMKRFHIARASLCLQTIMITRITEPARIKLDQIDRILATEEDRHVLFVARSPDHAFSPTLPIVTFETIPQKVVQGDLEEIDQFLGELVTKTKLLYSKVREAFGVYNFSE